MKRNVALRIFPFTGGFGQHCPPEAYLKLFDLGITAFATDYPEEFLQIFRL